MDLMVVEERLLAAQSKLRAQLGILPSSSRVAQTSGPVAVPVSAPFDDAIAQAASHLVRRLDVVTSMLEQHTDGLRAAASLLGTADSAAAHTATVLLDNARALVLEARRKDTPAVFHPRLLAFAKHWDFRPVACMAYRARTKGKDERGVGYVKANAVAGHDFASFAALEAHLAMWTRDVADVRTHGTTGEAPGLSTRSS